MRLSPLPRLSDTLHGVARPARSNRPRRHRQRLILEELEQRITLSVTPQMVLDINTTTFSSNPSGMVAIGSSAYFFADDGTHGIELWMSDGTAAGTALVRDIYPGIGNEYNAPGGLTNVNGTLFFIADDGTHGRELWKSDGTAAGTALVKDIVPGSGGTGAGYLTAVNGTLFFTANDQAAGEELWKSDGTAAGTVLVKDIQPGATGSYPSSLTNVNGTLFFSHRDYFGTYAELWKSDGTAAGTVLVKSFTPKPNVNDAPSNLTNLNGTLYFSAYTAANGSELWKSDGTAAGTALVKDIVPGSTGFYPSSLTNVNGTLFFTTVTGTELWKSNGTAAGTTLVKALSYPAQLTSVNGTLFFTADDPAHSYGRELWKSDGTAAGTTLVKDINASAEASGPYNLTNVSGVLYFTISHWNVNLTPSSDSGSELWKSDGTATGTVLLKSFHPISSFAVSPSSLTNANGTLLFATDDGAHGTELWESTGTEAGTALVKDINTLNLSSSPGNMADVNGTTFFTADDGVHGRELWKSDGTAAGTTLVKDVYPGGTTYYYGGYFLNSASPANLTNVNGTLFFTADDGTGRGLWKSDGTAAGTVRVRQLGYTSNFTAVNATLFFTEYDYVNGWELWKSDGTTAGTTLVKDIYPGSNWVYYPGGYGGWWNYVPNSSSPGNLNNVNGTLFFSAADGTTGRELWKSDGTAAGTVLVKDIFPGTGSGTFGEFANVDGTLFFRGSDGTTGYELWKSDGTAAGTVRVKDIRPGATSSYPNNLVNVNGTLFFSANDGTNGFELWKSNGTAAGTVMVKQIDPGGDGLGSSIAPLAVVGPTLYFSVNDGTHGIEMWRSDGTAAGTVMVKDINPGTGNTAFPSVATVGGTLYFTAYDGVGPAKLWRSDGTTAGTVVVSDLATSSLTNINGTLFFAAYDSAHGQELWKLVDDQVQLPPTLSISDVSIVEGNTGTRAATFTVTLSAASGQPVTVAFATANGTAKAGSDYQATSGTLTFAPGETSKTIAVPVIGDRVGEPTETFVVNLSSPTNASIADAQGVGTIVDDEPRISISDARGTEGNAGTVAFTFTVSLSAAYDAPVTVKYTTADGTATAGSDYQAASGTLTFAPGEVSKVITIFVYGDRVGEANETFLVKLSAPTNAAVADGVGVGTIVDDEPRIKINNVSKKEGLSGPTLFVFTITLSAAYDQAVTMSFLTADGTATTADGDYVAQAGTLTFNPGETTRTIAIAVTGDRKPEANELFYVDLSGNSSNSLLSKPRGIGTILNDD